MESTVDASQGGTGIRVLNYTLSTSSSYPSTVSCTSIHVDVYCQPPNSETVVKEEHVRHILVVRTDRIGDVLLSLPMISVLRATFPTARLSMLLREYTRELVEGVEGLDNILTYDRNGAVKLFFEMLGELRRERIDLVIVSYPTFRLAFLMFLAGIPTRVGTGYRWYSFLFNRRIFEHRKTAEKHELEYNLSMLRVLGCSIPSDPKIPLNLFQNDEERAWEIWSELELKEGDTVVVLHPGSGGSARDWPVHRFGELAKMFAQEECRIVVTGVKSEEALVKRVVEGAGECAKPLVGRTNLRTLAAFLRRCSLFVANSTGPLHIAAAVGVPGIGLYPPIRACSPERWGPWTKRKEVIVADAETCPRCYGGPCRGNDCMEQITAERVYQAATRLLGRHARISSGVQ